MSAIRTIVTVRADGILEVRSPELHQGDRAQVTIVVTEPANGHSKPIASDDWRRYAGVLNSANPRAGDNAQIDADLAREHLSG